MHKPHTYGSLFLKAQDFKTVYAGIPFAKTLSLKAIYEFQIQQENKNLLLN